MAKSVRVEVEVLGYREISQVFDALPKQIDKNKIWLKFWRENSKPLVKAAREKAQQVGKTGQLARSIGFFTTRASRKYNGGYVGPRVKGAFAKRDDSGKYSKSGYYGAWIEYGGSVMFGGRGTARKGDQPFMKPAWESAHQTVMSNGFRAAEKVFKRALKTHNRRLTKYGYFGY
tara:strand:+ start:572 stop:1093 length:522 start_codon:yes stop_codon:yes gene_type:complete